MRALRLLCVVALGLGACTIKDTKFTQGEHDAGHEDAGADANNGPLNFVVSSSSMTVTEGMTGQLMISLTSAPQGSLLATLEASDDTRLGITPPAVLFSPTDWSTPQAVTLTGKPDPDTANESLDLTLRSTAITAPMVVSVTVEDDDAIGLVLSPASLEVGEGTTGTVAVHLSAMPAQSITVNVASADTAVATVSQSNLVFTPANYAIDQTLVITGIQDVNTVTNPTTIDFTSTDLPAKALAVQVTDNDVLGISTSTSSLAITEGGNKTFTVQLTQQPSGNVTVNIDSANTAIATVSPAMLTFTPTDWNVGQTVTATAPADDDTKNDSTTVSLSATGLATRSIATSVTDDDTQAIVASANTLTVTEGMTGTVGIKLAFKPESDVTVSTSSLAPSVATVTPATLTFTPANYATNQNITVSGVQDANATDNTTTVRVEAGTLGLTKDVAITVDDDDTLAIETNMGTVAVTEGATATFQVRLTAQPSAATTVSIASGDNTSVTTTPTSLTFTTANYNTYQTVTVNGVQDVDLVSENGVVLTLTSSGIANKTVTVNVTDNDTQAIVASTTTTTVTEGSTGTVGVSLAFQPAASVTVSVTSGTPGAATVTPATLTFTTANYATPQNITISGVEDADAVNGSSTIALASTGLSTVNVAVTVSDNDALNLDVSPTTLSINEGSTGSAMVRLTAQPAAATTVNIASSDTGAATVSLASVSFSTSDWNTYKSVTVSALEDADAANESVTVTFSASGLTSRTTAVTVNDNDTQSIVLSATSINVNEGGTATFQVKLAAQPPGVTTVNLSSNNAAASLSATALAFDSTNWSTAQTITVTGVEDVNVANETAMISLTSTGITSASVTANVTDNDTQKVNVSTGTVTVNEGASTTVGVSLGFQPSGNYTVTVSSMNTAVATVSPTTLTFTASNYATAQLITISGAEDANAVVNSTTISLTASGATPGSVSVTVNDNDTQGIEVSATSVSVTEQSSTTISVKLAAEPTSDVTVNISSTDTSTVGVSPTAIVFSTSNWSTPRTITITGVNDSDTFNESETVRITSTGLTQRNVSVTVFDNDTANPYCGDGICNGLEDPCSCPSDCDVISPEFVPLPRPPLCCDGICQSGDVYGSCCQQDCGVCAILPSDWEFDDNVSVAPGDVHAVR